MLLRHSNTSNHWGCCNKGDKHDLLSEVLLFLLDVLQEKAGSSKVRGSNQATKLTFFAGAASAIACIRPKAMKSRQYFYAVLGLQTGAYVVRKAQVCGTACDLCKCVEHATNVSAECAH